MTDATRTLISAVVADIRLGLGDFLLEVLVTNGDWTEAFTQSGSDTMLQAPVGMGVCYMHIDDSNAGYAEIQIGSGATNVSTLTGAVPTEGPSFFRVYDSASSDDIQGGIYVGPRGDFILCNAFGPTDGETSHLVVSRGYNMPNDSDSNNFFIMGAGSSANVGGSQNAFVLKTSSSTYRRAWFNSALADNPGERMYLETTSDQAQPSDGPYPNQFPGTVDTYDAMPVRIGDELAGEVRGILPGILALNHEQIHQPVRNDNFASGSHTLVMPAGSLFGATQTNVDFDVFETSTTGQIYVTTDENMWPQ